METTESYQLARISAIEKESGLALIGDKEIFAQIEGKLRFSLQSPLDLPTVGDWVKVRLYNNGELAMIHEVLPRKSVLARKSAGKEIDYQLIAANIDAAFIVQSLDHNFNLRRLERCMAVVNEANILPLILLSKADLPGAEEIQQRVDEIHQLNGSLTVVPFSNPTGQGLENIRALIEPGKTYCLMGSSGVGKTTLLNMLIGEAIYRTAPVRGKGLAWPTYHDPQATHYSRFGRDTHRHSGHSRTGRDRPGRGSGNDL